MWMARIAGVFLLVFGLLPIANWIPGGHEAPWYGRVLGDWLGGAAVIGLVVLLTWILVRNRPPEATPSRWRSVASGIDSLGWRGDLAIAGIALCIGAVVAWLVHSGRPLLIDEIVQVFQARVFAGGALWAPSPEHPEFTSSVHILDLDGKRFAQFPPGWSTILALFSILKLEWLAGPILFGLAVLVFARLLRLIETDQAVRSLAAILLAVSPFAVFLGASHMNHIPTVALLLLAAYGLARTVDSDCEAGVSWPFLTGLALGAAATIRPTDAAAFALPTAAWLGWRAVRGRGRLVSFIASGIGIAIPIAFLFWYNSQTTGDPFLFGYVAYWGKSHGLGFHDAPWGGAHTPLRGIELINLYMLRLQFHLFELPVPGLLLPAAALLVTRSIAPFDRWMMTCGAMLLAAYFAYWHDGYFLGPRFVLPLVPFLVLWTARLQVSVTQKSGAMRRSAAVGVWVAIAWAVFAEIPVRVAVYQSGLQTMRWKSTSAARSLGVTGTVLVRESWGAQTLARLRQLGLPGEEVEWLYRGQDSCELELMVGQAERMADHGSATAVSELRQKSREPQAGLVALPEAADTSIRLLPGRSPEPVCADRFAEMQDGFTLYAPLLLDRSGLRFVRDLHARDTLLFAPGEEPVWLLTGDPVGATGPRFERLDVDSVRTAWGRSGGQ